jgi:replicative DNA helicase
MGKTAIAMNIAEHVAVEERKPVAVFSLEMGRQQLADRMLASVGQIDLGRIRSGKLQDEDWDRMTGALGKMHESPMHIDERATSVVQIRARARRLHRKTPLALIVIDYLQLMTEAKGDNRNEQLSNVTRALKLLARELQVPVICLSQLSRKVEDRGDKRPMLSDLRDSGAIEQDADVVILMFREEYYRDEPKGIAEAIVAKQRMGETGTIKLAWQGHHSRFRDLAPEDWAVINEAAQSKPKRGFRGD